MIDILPELNSKEYITCLLKDYDVHFCETSEVDELVAFIDTYWRKNHIFVLSRKLLDWQHYDSKNKRYNFVLARHRESGVIHSILGFIPTNQFDSEIKQVKIWPCIWKSREDIHQKGLGTILYYYLKTQLQIETISILGISEIALEIYKHWGFTTGKIEQYYLPNVFHKEILSQNRQVIDYDSREQHEWTLKYLSKEEYEYLGAQDNFFEAVDIYKSKKFFVNRYYNHPIYKYDFLAVRHHEKLLAILIGRECGNNMSICFRIVDFIGDIGCLGHIKRNLQSLMLQKNYEYIDFMTAGFTAEIIKNSGFINRTADSRTIIPNFFEPFSKENIDLDFAYKTINQDYRFAVFKADADQDRPNLISDSGISSFGVPMETYG